MNKSSGEKRTQSTAVVCPIVYGSVAMHLGKKSEEYSTHRWKLYIRGPNNEDLSCFIQKVAFTLHPSFAEPIREVKRAPFEVSETGWGEFEASIRIFFKDPDERPLDLFHLIKLYPPGPPQLSGSLKKPAPVVAEQYDEVVFNEPTESFTSLLMAYTSKESKPQATLQIEGVPVSGTLFDDSLDLERLHWIQDHVLREIDAAKDRLMSLQTQLVAITQQRRMEQRMLKAQQISGEGGQQPAEGSEEGATEIGGASSSAKVSGRGSGGGTGASKATGSKASAGSSTAKRARPSTGAAAVSNSGPTSAFKKAVTLSPAVVPSSSQPPLQATTTLPTSSLQASALIQIGNTQSSSAAPNPYISSINASNPWQQQLPSEL